MLCFAFTDVEGSTALWADQPHAMMRATERLDEIVEKVVARRGGTVVKDRGEGDSHFTVFPSATPAVHACAELVDAVDREPWPDELDLKVRVGIHVGEATTQGDDYYGLAVSQTTRIRGLGHGGQVLASQTVVEIAEHLLDEDLEFQSHGTHRVRDFNRRQEIFQLVGRTLPTGFPRLNAADLDVAPLAAVTMIDIVGSSQFATASHEELVRAVEQWQRVLAGGFDEFSGATLRSVGDSCAATFRDPRDAVGFARATRERLAATGTEIRAGIHFGSIDVVGDDITGRSVFLTSELVRLAMPGQILVSPAVRDLLEAVGYATTPAGTFTISKHGLTWEASEA